ncbi:MAG: methyltransferase family protein [Thermoanaerobaculia bacterium]
MWIVRHAFAIAVLPVTVAILVPLWLSRRYGVTFRPPAGISDLLCVILGALLMLAGFALFVATVFLFATEGHGTLAPWDPPARLVLRGPYRFVRNPMISGVLFIIVGESLVVRSLALAGWAGVFLLMNAIWIPLFEEPQLERRFGADYRAYMSNVRRFVPRLRPWSAGST